MKPTELQRKLMRKIKQNLILSHNEDDELILRHAITGINYAESYQHLPDGYYSNKEHQMPATTEQAIIMLASHLYESRDGSTAGFFNDNIMASRQVWDTVHSLLRLDRVWGV